MLARTALAGCSFAPLQTKIVCRASASGAASEPRSLDSDQIATDVRVEEDMTKMVPSPTIVTMKLLVHVKHAFHGPVEEGHT